MGLGDFMLPTRVKVWILLFLRAALKNSSSCLRSAGWQSLAAGRRGLL